MGTKVFWVGIAFLLFGALGIIVGPIMIIGGVGAVFENLDDDGESVDASVYFGMGILSMLVGFIMLIAGIVMALIGRRQPAPA